MFKAQQVIVDILPALRQLLDKHARPSAWIDTYATKTREFVVRVPLVGAFSAGKSSLLNALIGETLFATSIDPETAVPAEISFAARATITGVHADGRRSVITREALRENRLDDLQRDGWVEVELPTEQLAAIKHLRLVDMPGWDSGLDGHKRAIDGYAHRSLAYGVVVSAEEGNLRQSLRIALIELATRGLPIVALISKSDKKSPQDCADVARLVEREIAEATGKPPLCVAIVSARKREVAPFVDALGRLEALAEPLFGSEVLDPFTREVAVFSDFLETLVNRDNLDGEKLAVQLDQLTKELAGFERQLDQDTQELEKRALDAVERIVESVQSRLTGEADSFARQALQGTDIGARIEAEIRLAVTQGIAREFTPELRRYCGKVAESIPLSIRPSMGLPGKSASGGPDFDEIGKLIVAVAPLLNEIPVVGRWLAPIMKHVLPILGMLEGNKALAEIAEARRREALTQQILNDIIPAAVVQTRMAIEPPLRAQVEEAKVRIVESVREQRATLSAALEQAQRDRARQKAEYEALREQHRADTQAVRAILKQLGDARG